MCNISSFEKRSFFFFFLILFSLLIVIGLQGKTSFISQEGILQLNNFIFVLAIMQIVYSFLTMALGRAKVCLLFCNLILRQIACLLLNILVKVVINYKQSFIRNKKLVLFVHYLCRKDVCTRNTISIFFH